MRRIRIGRFQAGFWKWVEDLVAEEGLLTVELAPGRGFSAVITPEKIKEFVFGHLLAEGLIRKKEDVLEYHERLDQTTGVPGDVIHVELKLRELPEPPPKEEAIWTACGEGEGHLRLDPSLKPSTPQPLVSAAALVQLPRLVAGEIEDFRLTGAYHYAFLFDPKLNLRASAKDIGRHNAVDKAIGEALLHEGAFRERVLFTTGRISADIALKTLRVGIPLLASRGAPLFGAIALARRYNLGLIGFLRGDRFNIYSGEGWLS